MNGNDNDAIRRFQENMLMIRRAAGWTAQEFGDRIGVTRQTINNIERLEPSPTQKGEYKYRLTKTQYIASRSVLDAEITRLHNEDHLEEEKMLKSILIYLVDYPEKLDRNEKEHFLNTAKMMTSAIATKTMDKEVVSKEWVKTMGEFLGDILATAAVGVWLYALLGNSKPIKKRKVK